MKSVKLIGLIALGLSLAGCPDPNAHFLTDPHYLVHLYYKNSKGENLLDPATVGHFNGSDVRINGEASDFSIDSTSYKPNLPRGFALVFIPSRLNNVGLDVITLSSKITDTLSNEYSGSTLLNCYYNGKSVLPSNLTSPSFSITIVK